MSKVNYIVIDETDPYHLSVGKYETEEAMLNAVEHKDLSDIEVWEVKRRVRLMKRPAVVLDDRPEEA